MVDEADLKPGSFYWVQPVFDVDFDAPEFRYVDGFSDERAAAARNHWSQNKQPALYQGLTKDGRQKWLYIGVNEPDFEEAGHWWPVCWIGEEITIIETTAP